MAHHRLRLCVVIGALFTLVGTANAFAATVVVSEFRVRGPQGGNDELIELYNTTTAPIDISGWKVKGSNSAGTNSARATIPAGRILGAGCHYLLTNTSTNGYSGTVPGDQSYTPGVTDDGGIALTLSDDTVVDQLGMSAGSAFGEGTRLASLGSTLNADRGYERKPGGAAGNAQDTNDNAADFSLVSPSNPQNQLSTCIPPAVSTSPSGTGAATPSSLEPGASTLLTVAVTPGTNPASTGLTVTGDLSSIGGSAPQAFADDGASGDATAGDNVYSYAATVEGDTLVGAKSLPVSIVDTQGRLGSTAIALTVTAPSKPPSLGTPVVLNEFRVRGPAGGNDEFVELYNASSSTIAIDGMKISGSNSSGTVSVRVTVPAGRVLGAGCYYLFTNSGAYSGSVPGDQSYTTGITDDGGIALMAADNTILDQVGLSSGSAYGEGTRLATLGTMNADRGYGRAPAGYDTNSNADDFTLVSPSTPQNSAACGVVLSATGAASPSSVPVGTSTLLTVSVTPGANPPTSGIAVSADLSSIGGSATQAFADDGSGGDAVAGDNVLSYMATIPAGTVLGAKSLPATASDAEGRSASTSINLTVEAPPPLVAIREIQGAAHISPRLGELVATQGVVTGKIGSSFYIQDPDPDADPATSEGIQIFGATATNTVSVGELAMVRGRVTEFRASSSTSPNPNLSITELTSPTILSNSSTPVTIAPTVIGIGGRTQPSTVIEDDASSGNVETSGVFDPDQDGLDFYESLEGMLVQMNDLVSTSYTFTNFGEIWVVADNGANATVMSPRGALVISPGDLNPERIVIDDEMFRSTGARMPEVNTGASFPGAHVGIMEWAFGEYRIQLRQAPVAATTGVSVRESTIAAGPNQVSIATFNVENLDANESQSKFDTLAEMIVDNLAAPDIVGLEEIQDNNGATNDSVVAAEATLAKLILAIQNAGGPTYDYRQINPVDDQDGGEPGGNIRVGFLFRTDRGLAFVDRPGGDSTTAVSVVSGPDGPQLSVSPGRIAPANEAWSSSRKPLAAEFTYNGHKLFVVVNHFNSKGGDQGLWGPWQPPFLSSEVQRNKQATLVAGFVGELLAADPTANVAVVGDINDFQFSPPMQKLKDAGLVALIETLPPNERYSYVFDGNGQALDHILVSGNVMNNAAAAAGYDIVHVNAEFLEQASDHDPQLVRLTMPAPSMSASRTPAANAAGWNNTAVTVSFMCVDPLSAIVGGCPAPVTLSSEGVNQAVSRSVATEGGLALTAGVSDIDIDLTDPTVTYTGGKATYGIDENVSITCTAADALSGIASTTCTNISGPAASFGPGTHTFSASALDRAGNTGTGSVSFTVVVSHTGLCALVQKYVDKEGVAHALCSKLEAAARKADRKDQEADLHAFVNQVEAQSGKSLTAEEAAMLIRLVTSL